MKKLTITLLAILSLSFVAFGQKAKPVKTDPAKDVRAVFDRLIEGIKQSDATKVMSVYDKSERTLFFNSNGSATLGWEPMKSVRENLYSKTKDVSINVTGLRVEILGPNAAYVSCKWTQIQEYDGKMENSAGRMTLVFKLIGKEWKVVHLHTSPDATKPDRTYLDSERTMKDNLPKEPN
jgi:ketosteroid isomerase-like protein